MLPKVLEKLISEEIINCEIIEIALNSHLYHAEDMLKSYSLKINCENFKERYGPTFRITGLDNKILGWQQSNASESTNDISIISNEKDSDFLGDSFRQKIQLSDHSVEFINNCEKRSGATNYNSNQENSNSYFSDIVKQGIDPEDAESIINFIISTFFVKYEQASYSNIKKLSKFENAILNFITQQLDSKKFKKKYGDCMNSLSVEVIASALLKYLVSCKVISIEDGKVDHNTYILESEKEKFEALV